MLWSPGDAVRQSCFQHKFELCSGGRSIVGTATLTLVPHSSLQSCPKSCWCLLLLCCFLSRLLCHHCGALLYLHIPTAHCDCGPQLQTCLSPSNVEGTACDNPTLLAQSRQLWVTGSEAAARGCGGCAGGWRSRGGWDTAHLAEWHSCLFLFMRQCWLYPWQPSHFLKSCASPCGKR